MSMDIVQHFLPGILSTGTVAINTHDSGMGKPMGQSCFHTLRAVAERGNVLVATFRAVCRKVLLVATMMAAQFLSLRCTTRRLAQRLQDAVHAHDLQEYGGITAAIYENEALLI